MLQLFLNNFDELTVWDILFMVVAYSILVLVILPFHEFAHAWAAHLCGDDTAKWHGRLTLNPFAHLDVWGTVMLVLVGVGYAKPVPVVSRNFRHYKRDLILVALAGPCAKLLMAIAAAGLFRLCAVFVTDETALSILWLVLINVIMSVNVRLAVFNLLPIPPLDGSRLWSTLLPGRWAYTLERYNRQITMVLFVLLLTGALDRPLQWINNIFMMGVGRLVGLV